MKLKVGDVVEFKSCEDVKFRENASIYKDGFPKCGKVKYFVAANEKVLYFFIEGYEYAFVPAYVAKTISSKKG